MTETMTEYSIREANKRIQLTEQQEKYLEAIEWLISDTPATGKTFLLAIAFIKKAIKFKREWVKVFDHRPYLYCGDYILKQISYMLKKLEIEHEIKYQEREFRVLERE
jgi:hypothetical protein